MVDQVRRAAILTTLFDDETFTVLSALADLFSRYECIPVKAILSKTGMPERKVLYELDILSKEQACVRSASGYRMTMLGLDALALHQFSSAGLVEKLGPIIAMGKESDVYEAIGGRSSLALKFFRMGRVSFRQVKRKRSYLANEGHRWLIANIRSAAREAAILQKLSGKGFPVPTFRGRRYHAVLMGMELAIPLYKVRELDDPEKVMRKIFDALRRIYLKAGLINGDLSEFNILLTPVHDIILIDWPQAVNTDGANAEELLERDLMNILAYFSKRFGVWQELPKVVKYVKSIEQSL